MTNKPRRGVYSPFLREPAGRHRRPAEWIEMDSHIITRDFDKAMGFAFSNGYAVLIAPFEYHGAKSPTRIQLNYCVPITVIKNQKPLKSLPFYWWLPGDDGFAVATPEEVVEALSWALAQETDDECE